MLVLIEQEDVPNITNIRGLGRHLFMANKWASLGFREDGLWRNISVSDEAGTLSTKGTSVKTVLPPPRLIDLKPWISLSLPSSV